MRPVKHPPLRFRGIWLDAPTEALVAHVGERHGDASDADAAVVRAQPERDIGPDDWLGFDAVADLDSLLDTELTRTLS